MSEWMAGKCTGRKSGKEKGRIFAALCRRSRFTLFKGETLQGLLVQIYNLFQINRNVVSFCPPSEEARWEGRGLG
ncbi:MAG TPA: hypothetical protein H9857_02695, partial [Candidatus Desulfovibrio intestinigallinarum]|nr:hypothetical protein [Candidatus Desulfovibrio intestinigallinarum]